MGIEKNADLFGDADEADSGDSCDEVEPKLCFGGANGGGRVAVKDEESGFDGCEARPLTTSGDEGELSLKADSDEADLGPLSGEENGLIRGALIFKGVLGPTDRFEGRVSVATEIGPVRETAGEGICMSDLKSSMGATCDF